MLMYYLVGFFLTIAILVAVHEWGHFIVARLCGVGVLRFSIGFGPILWSRKDKHGTEWAISLIPLGGYVKMIDEREGPVEEALLPHAFTQKTILQRVAIVSAGPIINLLLAFVLFVFLHLIGIKDILPIIDKPLPNTVAAKAGLVGQEKILKANGQKVQGWSDIRRAIIEAGIEHDPLSLQVKLPDGTVKNFFLKTDGILQHPANNNLGLYPPRPEVPATVYRLQPDMPAQRAGLKAGDRIVMINDQSISNWFEMAQVIRSLPAKRISITVERPNHQENTSLEPLYTRLELSVLTDATASSDGRRLGRIGIEPNIVDLRIPEALIFRHALPLPQAIAQAAQKTWGTSIMILRFIGGIFTGEVSWRFLNGPLVIAEVAGESLKDGFNSFIQLIAAISISLGIMNLLPLPVLDGGHLLFLGYEAITRRPPAPAALEWLSRMGAIILILLMVLVFYNDLQRFI